jgi:hypothetical protein
MEKNYYAPGNENGYGVAAREGNAFIGTIRRRLASHSAAAGVRPVVTEFWLCGKLEGKAVSDVARRRPYGQPIAGGKRAVHDRDGNEDAEYQSRLTHLSIA